MKGLILGLAAVVLSACSGPSEVSTTELENADWVDLSKREKPSPIVNSGWDEVNVFVHDLEDIARFWTEIGGYETVKKSADDWLLRSPGSEDGYIRLLKNEDAEAVPVRPANAEAWDTGCYWSIMMRAKNLSTIIDDAKSLGWEPLTDMAFLEFGPSKLNVVVLTHMNTGTKVQLYERLTTPLPEGFPEFERVSRPFNIMQMVKDQETAYDFFQQVLGFETFYFGKPTVSLKEEVMPLNIPPEMTTTIPYKAAIVYPQKGMEWGRLEMIEVDGMPEGRDFADQCDSSSNGTIGVVYKIPFVDSIIERMKNTGYENHSPIIVSSGPGENQITRRVNVWSPDGANIIFEDVH